MSEPKRPEAEPSLSHDEVARVNWARHDRRPLIERLAEAIDRARQLAHDAKEAAQ